MDMPAVIENLSRSLIPSSSVEPDAVLDLDDEDTRLEPVPLKLALDDALFWGKFASTGEAEVEDGAGDEAKECKDERFAKTGFFSLE